MGWNLAGGGMCVSKPTGGHFLPFDMEYFRVLCYDAALYRFWNTFASLKCVCLIHVFVSVLRGVPGVVMIFRSCLSPVLFVPFLLSTDLGVISRWLDILVIVFWILLAPDSAWIPPGAGSCDPREFHGSCLGRFKDYRSGEVKRVCRSVDWTRSWCW